VKATRFEFRIRVFIICALYFLGFFAPWERLGASANPNPPRLWSWLAIEAARTGLVSTGVAYLIVTVAAVALAVLAAWLRVWGTAYLGSFVMRNQTMQAGAVMGSGPYRYLRNPLYLGMLLNAFAVSILMPVTGALAFLVGIVFFTARLIGGEEAFLSGELGKGYLEYRKSVPAIVPSLRPRLLASSIQPQWMQSLIAEVYPVGAAACFVALAWSYDADLLTRCVLVCFGLSLIARAIARPTKDVATRTS
jgi:protein-S-isoprenylcysteine O-methyltransferase Ste14